MAADSGAEAHRDTLVSAWKLHGSARCAQRPSQLMGPLPKRAYHRPGPLKYLDSLHFCDVRRVTNDMKSVPENEQLQLRRMRVQHLPLKTSPQ